MPTEKTSFKKIDREFVLSDSTKNVYGFRLKTDGYQIDEFKKSPIGFYNHLDDDGVLVRWDDLRIATKFSQAISAYVRSMTITYISGLTAPNGPVTGIFNNTIS